MQMPEPAHTAEWKLDDYLEIVLRRKFIILIIFFVVLGIGVVYTFTRPAFYGSATAFIIQENDDAPGGTQDLPSWILKPSRSLEYYYQIIFSSVFLEIAVKTVEQDSVLNSFPAEMDALQLARSALGTLRLSKDDNSNIMTLSVTARDPVIAYRVAEIVTDAFRVRNQQIEMEGARNVEEFIAKQRAEAQARLESIERELQEFHAGKQAPYTAADQILVSRVQEVEETLTEIETQRQLSETNLASYEEQVKKYYAPDAAPDWFLKLPDVQAEQTTLEKLEQKKNDLSRDPEKNQAALLQLNQEIEDQKKRLIQKIFSQIDRAAGKKNEPQVLRNALETRFIEELVNFNSLKNKENYYRAILEEYRRQSPQILERALALARLQRTQNVSQHLLTYLAQRYEEAKIRVSAGSSSMRILNPAAIPTEPLPQNRARSMVMSALLGLGLALGLVLALEYLDPAVRNRAEIERRTGLVVVGQIPQFVNKPDDPEPFETFDTLAQITTKKLPSQNPAHARQYPLINKMLEPGIFAESFRNLRTDLHFFKIDQPVKKLLISSAIRGEGKSLITANLGLAFAELGKRVLIIDGDLRRPRQHSLFSVQREPGLTDILASGEDWHSALVPIQGSFLSLMPAGAIPPNPTEILNSRKMSDLISAMEKEYEYILVDSPPLLALSDARVLSTVVHDILLLYRYAFTNFRLTLESIDSLKNSHCSIVGLVLNGINPRSEHYYYKFHYWPKDETEQ